MFHHVNQFSMRQEQDNCVGFIFWQFREGMAPETVLIRIRWTVQQLYESSPSCVAVARSTSPEEGVRNTDVDEGISLREIDPAS